MDRGTDVFVNSAENTASGPQREVVVDIEKQKVCCRTRTKEEREGRTCDTGEWGRVRGEKG